MKKIKTILMAVFALSVLSFTFKNSSVFQENLEDIGIIKQSLLKPKQFNDTQKGTWVLLNGQEINKESELFKILESNFDLNILTKKTNKFYLPNASGAFIRSANVNGEGVDPDVDRLVGSYQADALKKHRHSFNSHGAGGGYGNVVDGQSKQKIEINTSYFGDKETRPKNISMYTYIKISD
jgi:hypothetical protein